MADSVKDSFSDLERHRLMLSQNIAKLQASLQHWREWEIEYEGLKEEILALDDDSSLTPLEGPDEDVAEPMFPGQKVLLTAKERRLLLRDDKGNLRNVQQVNGLVSRRLDYVQQNIKTIYSLLKNAEEKHAASQVLIKPEVRNEEGLPLTEIIEELDADAGSTSEPGQMAPQLVEALERNGVTDLPIDNSATSQKQETRMKNMESSNGVSTSNKIDKTLLDSQGLDRRGPIPSNPIVNGPAEKSSKSRKSVSFAAEVKVDDVTIPVPDSLKNTKSQNTRIKESQPATTPSTKEDSTGASNQSVPLYEKEKEKPFDPVIPIDESPEDAALRREMIKYNMGEVGAIVAELDLDENNASYSDGESGEEDYDYSSVEEDEDQHGRTKQRVLTNEYLAEMQKLQQRLKNVGPAAAQSSSPRLDDSKVPQKDNSISNEGPRRPKGPIAKGVRFAEELDIQEAPNEILDKVPTSEQQPVSTQNAHVKHIHTPNVVERPFTGSSSSSHPTEPDEYDPGLLNQEVRTQYHRMRNDMIQRQGGFMAPDEDDETGEVPLTEAEGGPKKMSRFKAARLGKSGL